MMLKLLIFLVVAKMVVENGLLHAVDVDSNSSRKPKEVNIGAIFAFNSTIGKVAIQAAVDDVNASPLVLNGTKINITMQDSNNNCFLGIVEGVDVFCNSVKGLTSRQIVDVQDLMIKLKTLPLGMSHG
ncbi:glutamate receptor 3.3-like [Silene latifolia]|uniref:glutamate receptor 3.3-like n=1 Tax=Silene latifolia TaxID=37657 RepID=UPI003D77FF0E